MTPQDVLKNGMDMGDMVCNSYLADLSDADLLVRPHPQCNHINWQIGHLILSENQMVGPQFPGALPPLPAGFEQMYSRENASCDDPARLCDKATLLKTHQEQRAAVAKALAGTSNDDLAKATGIDYAPTVAAVFNLLGDHWLMHCGQWVVVRRALGKPIVM